MRLKMRQRTAEILAPILGALLVFALPPVSAAAPLEDENLLALIPDGFQIGKQGTQGPMIISEFVPKGETVSDWSRMVTIQVYRNMKKFNPDQFAENLKGYWSSACAGSEVVKSREGQESGYAFSLWVFTCPLNPATGKPESMFAKFISGNDALYSVQYAYRSAMTKEMVTPAVNYLAGVRVCDSRLPDRLCPKVSP